MFKLLGLVCVFAILKFIQATKFTGSKIVQGTSTTLSYAGQKKDAFNEMMDDINWSMSSKIEDLKGQMKPAPKPTVVNVRVVDDPIPQPQGKATTEAYCPD